MPGITTIDKVADDVYSERLNIATEHWDCQSMDVAFINSKGFGGNNATATLFSPAVTLTMMEKRHGRDVMASYRDKSELVQQARVKYQTLADHGEFQVIYRFGDGTLTDDDVTLTDADISVTGFSNKIVLSTKNPFADMV
jgi:acetoacetyl-[acyl-carrier protein] synthase